jgi:hypothetical protein
MINMLNEADQTELTFVAAQTRCVATAQLVAADLRTIDNGANEIAGKCALEIGNHHPCPAGADA